MAQDRRKVLWFEGMTLDPHHLQQWDRYQQSMLNARTRSLSRYDWGLTQLEIDRDRLANGEFRLLRCSGVLPDGLVFDMPDFDLPPAPLNVQDAFGATRERLGVTLAVPAGTLDGRNVALQGADNRRETRFRAQTISVRDENTGADEREIEAAAPGFQLRFDSEPMESYTAVRLAEILRDPSGAFIVNERFVPTCVRVAASSTLMNLARRILEQLVAKSLAFSERIDAIKAQRELSPADLMVVGQLGAINACIPIMKQHYEVGESAPEALFSTLLSLAGQLSVYVSGSRPDHPRDYPCYDHADPSDGFNRLRDILADLIVVAAPPANFTEIPLQLLRDNLYTAEAQEGLLRNAQLFVVARSDQIPEDRLIAELPHMLRIATPQTIDEVLGSAVQALPLEHTTRLPAGMRVDGQANYFQLQKRGRFWSAIEDDCALAIFVPGEFKHVNLKLVAVEKP